MSCSASKLPVATLDVGGHTVKAELAIDPAARQNGLMHRDQLGADRGMLFIYPDKKPRSFWMKDTRIPLSIAFIEDDGTILKILPMEPFDTRSIKSLYPVRYALEMRQGWFEANGVTKGDAVTNLPQDVDVQ